MVDITLTPSAINRISFLQESEGGETLYLRVSIMGGGCSGFQYSFAFVNHPDEDDQKSVITTDQGAILGLVVDPLSYPFLRGAKVDYQTGLYGARFVVSNPNAKGTCGCGSSFSV